MSDSAAPKPGVRILIVDDSGFSRKTLRLHLEALGHTVEEAADGFAALEQLEKSFPALVILDLVMPGISGNEVLTRMHAIDPKLPIIISTSDIQAMTRDDVQIAGARALINKPIKREMLDWAINTALAGGNSWS